MNEDILDVYYFVDGILNVIPTKMIYESPNEDEIQNIHFKINLETSAIISKTHDVSEYAIIYLQKALPENMSIACCQSCRHGNFCPYGDCDNEIFCLKDIKYNSKHDLCEFFSTNSDYHETRSRKLLNFCRDFEPISGDEYYTYNSWEHDINAL